MIMAEHTEYTTAQPAAVWELWSQVERWAEWDTDLDFVTITGPFRKGATGYLKPKGFLKLKFSITECRPEKMFVDQTKMFLGRLVFTHTLEKQGDRYAITHRAEARGPLGWFYALMMGRGMRRDLPLSMKKLVEVAEHGTQ